MTDMNGKVVVVTGATAGIGAVTARELARLGARVLGVGRNPAKCAAAAAEIRAATGNAQVDYLVADLSAQAEVRRVADEILSRAPRLDVLVNNAGAYMDRRQESPDGIELTFALNHLSYFLLTNLLWDALAAAPAGDTGAGRVVNVSSAAHFGGRLDFDDLENRRRYSGFAVYSQSKLANVLFTYELARRLTGTAVTANAVHPGFVATQFGHNNGGFLRAALQMVQRFGARTPEQGAATSIYLASSPEVAGVTGKYFVDQRAVKSSAESYDEAAAQRLWAISEALTGLRVKV